MFTKNDEPRSFSDHSPKKNEKNSGSSAKSRQRLKTLSRILKFFFFFLLFGVLGISLMIFEGFPIWAYILILMAANIAWYLWTDRKRRCARASELLRATEHENLCPQMGEWLDSATRGLGVMAKKRITEDIASHYLDARAAALEEGLPAPEAELRAIKTLGNPRSARRGFRKVYLTKREEAWIRKIYNPGTSRERRAQDMAPVLIGLGILNLGLFARGYLVDGENHSGSITIGLFILVLGVTAWLQYRWMQKGLARRAKITELLGFAINGCILLPVMFVQGIDPDASQFYRTATTALPFIFLYFIVLGARTLAKLPKELSPEERRFFGRES